MKKSCSYIGLCLLVVLVVAGCASTKVTSSDQLVTGKLPRPQTIWVQDFVATSGDVPADSAIAGQYSEHAAPQTPEEIAVGREVGAIVAMELVKQIRDMGVPGARASTSTQPQLNDIILRGYLLSVEEGSAAKRFAVGFGSGTSELKTLVEGFQVTAQGLRKLGSGTLDSSGGKGPGTAASLGVALATGNPVGLIVSSGVKIYGEKSGKSKIEGRAAETAKEIAEVLKKRFKEQGWIN